MTNSRASWGLVDSLANDAARWAGFCLARTGHRLEDNCPTEFLQDQDKFEEGYNAFVQVAGQPAQDHRRQPTSEEQFQLHRSEVAGFAQYVEGSAHGDFSKQREEAFDKVMTDWAAYEFYAEQYRNYHAPRNGPGIELMCMGSAATR